MTSQNRQYVGASFAGTIDISATTPLYNLPTKTAVRSGVVNLSSTSALNIIGALALTIQSSGLVTNQTLLITSTGGMFGATLTLDNGGTVAGKSTYSMKSGEALNLKYDGTNLVQF